MNDLRVDFDEDLYEDSPNDVLGDNLDVIMIYLTMERFIINVPQWWTGVIR
jgi:hypothetical protein